MGKTFTASSSSPSPQSQVSITQQEISKIREQLFEAELRLLTADGHRGAHLPAQTVSGRWLAH